MLHEDLNDISDLKEKIERALVGSNFIELASLSSKLEAIVQLIADNSDYRKNIRKEELDTLKNLLIQVSLKDSYKLKNENFIWLNLTQIKKLNFKKGILNPFVKTILFMI